MSLSLECLHQKPLLLWGDPAKYVSGCNRVRNVLLVFQCCRIDPRIRMRNAGSLCNGSNGVRIIAGNNAKVNSLLYEVLNCFRSGLSDLVLDTDKTQELRRTNNGVVFRYALHLANHKHSFKFIEDTRRERALCNLLVHNKLSRTHNITYTIIGYAT